MDTHLFEKLMKESDKIESLLTLVRRIFPEVQAVLAFSEDLIPTWKLLMKTMKEIAPLIREMNDSITASHAKLPEATSRLDIITSETENITENIMDTIDKIGEKLDSNGNNNSKILSLLKESGADNENIQQAISLLEENKANTDELQNMSFEIMNSLQFQDITTQQINHANSIIEQIHTRFSKILNIYDGKDTTRMERVYDPNATTMYAHARQDTADDIFGNPTEAPEAAPAADNSGEVSQAEIDALMNGGAAKKEEPAGESVSQAEIDALMNPAPKKKEEDTGSSDPISQDEIDKLLNSTQ